MTFAFTDLVESIEAALSEVGVEEYPRGRRYFKMRESVPFNLPATHAVISWKKSAERVIRMMPGEGFTNELTVSVPFNVEQIGPTEYIARA